MENLTVQYLILDEDEADLFEDDERAQTLAATIIAGSEVSRQDHIDTLFITTMGVDVSTFSLLLTTGFAQYWYETPVPCYDPNQCSLNAAGALGLVLHYLSSTMHAVSLQQIFAIIPSTLLLCTLHTIQDAKIQWPGGLDFEHCSELVVAHHGRLRGAFSSIDGLKLPVQTSEDVDIENATFNCSVLVFSAEGVIIAAQLNALGSWHDSRVAHQIYTCAPLKQGQHIQGTLAEIDEQMVFNHELLSYQQTAEWSMHGLQGAFGGLRDLIEIFGINQIWTVYLKHWQETDDDIAVWSDFENMLFSEQRQKDRVACFHVTLEYK
ncbi:uncharacterized protein EDB93DRAFT_1242629 [Suillus bovinus]|uniref:uncharacterized protein n=1 Tax=Suillus bovinus TaxID=48563 RepID=UPI001B876404|nr:uncharacterized protein EDB93DRAFT_1242629 [Suillus bovinus]KAG2134547.1 hypothetical protein EDB93DRAFT_1242629 [Suillus bovinus]